jgi:3-hydroxyacyl-CoA dehydrogenase/enoyl-CoA hydratase/3-hydroxybutyryl-CoA epimerase
MAERHWRRDTPEDGICRLTLDKAGSTANTLSQDVLAQLDEELAAIEADTTLKGLIILSGKPRGFVLGADVAQFSRLTSAAQGAELAAAGQQLMSRVAALRVPTAAAIDGFALGGGLELALACDYRVAALGYERTLGLPEVQLGIHPGFGGTVRLVELLGAPKALDLMLTGRSVSPREARSLGLIDRCVPADRLESAAAELIERRPAPGKAPRYLGVLKWRPLRRAVARNLRARVARRARPDHYPAPYALIDLWVEHGGHGAAAYRAEAESIGRLLMTRTSKNLVRMFGLRERLRNLAPKSDAIRRVHVVGAGVMGGDIAAWCALQGLDVTLQDRAEEYVKPALERAETLFAKRLKAPGAPAEARRRLVVDIAAADVGAADLIIEAIVEKLDAKQSLLRELEPKLGDEAIVATNTSSLKLEAIAEALERPERFVGLHFFNPVARLPLVEVVRGERTDDRTMDRALAFVTGIGKLPLPCRSAPGFVVNRILTPYMLEALLAHQDGHEFETIDDAAESFGMPVGPIELADRVGLDVALHVARILSDVIGLKPPPSLQQLVDEGRLGVKSGRGFYTYRNGRAQKARRYRRADADLIDRLILPMLNQAVACYRDGVVEDLDLLDAGVVFGTGFAPFTGGPVNYARQRGIDDVVERLAWLAQRFGARFEPHSGWRSLEPDA